MLMHALATTGQMEAGFMLLSWTEAHGLLSHSFDSAYICRAWPAHVSGGLVGNAKLGQIHAFKGQEPARDLPVP